MTVKDDELRFDPKQLAALLTVIVIVVGFIVWAANTNSKACSAEEISKKNSEEIARLSTVYGQIETQSQILLRIERDVSDLKQRVWEYGKNQK